MSDPTAQERWSPHRCAGRAMRSSAQPQLVLLLSALAMVMGTLQHTREQVMVQRGQRGTVQQDLRTD